MKIDKELAATALLGEAKGGDCFSFSNRLYMVCYGDVEVSVDETAVVELETGEVSLFKDTTEVLPVKLMVIKDEE